MWSCQNEIKRSTREETLSTLSLMNLNNEITKIIWWMNNPKSNVENVWDILQTEIEENHVKRFLMGLNCNT